jgi:signal transduction histidine kinase
MIKSLRRRFILFSVLVIGSIVFLVSLFIFIGSPSDRPVHNYVVTLLAAIGLVFVGSLLLSGLAVKPIRAAWQKQLDFTADASHELRTPIAVIQTSLELVMDSPDETIESQMKWLKNIEAENHRMAKLVEDLLTLSRADTGQQTTEKETFMLDEAIEETLAPFVPLAEAKGLALSVAVKEKSAFYGDRKRIMQLLVILVDNALHYTEHGEITVVLGVSEKEITLTVSDTGRGMATEYLGKIFDRFYRVTDTRGMHQDGSGLGLSIAKWIVAEHGGTIRVESTLGRGTMFTVILPMRMA